MRAADLDEAIALANDQPFGLTSGIQSLDDREVARWLEGIEAGNLYVNRPITGAIVGRQPFGGWKASAVGPGAKAGGPNYVLQLCRAQPIAAVVEDEVTARRAATESYGRAWREHFSRSHEPIRLLGERNVFRYRPCRGLLVRGEAATPAGRLALEQVLIAARTCGVPVTVSLAAGEPGGPGETGEIAAVVQTEAELIAGLAGARVERLRALVPLSREVRAAAHAAGIVVLDAPVLAAGRLELRAYLREQAVSRVVHRYGSVLEPVPDGLA
jgi:RHH-type proline utilization regulon transcriptional repressor/proline dehydrogenase/delta 1-pyrroline-5-carboxylate dehydrogenase